MAGSSPSPGDPIVARRRTSEMQTALRIVAGFNTAFQGIVGAAAVVAPMAIAGTFGVAVAPSDVFLAVVRMFGGLLFASGLTSGLIAWRPDIDPWLRRIFALGLLGNVAADIVILATGELGLAQLGFGMALETTLATLLLLSTR